MVQIKRAGSADFVDLARTNTVEEDLRAIAALSKASDPLVLAAAAGNGTGTPVKWDGGIGFLMARGTWGGASAKLQFGTSELSPSFVDLDDTAVVITANKGQNIQLPAGWLRVVISGGTSSAIDVTIERIPT